MKDYISPFNEKDVIRNTIGVVIDVSLHYNISPVSPTNCSISQFGKTYLISYETAKKIKQYEYDFRSRVILSSRILFIPENYMDDKFNFSGFYQQQEFKRKQNEEEKFIFAEKARQQIEKNNAELLLLEKIKKQKRKLLLINK